VLISRGGGAYRGKGVLEMNHVSTVESSGGRIS
jgi:hypothetical protein